MKVMRLLWQSWPWRWLRSASALLRGVRLSPQATLLGSAGRFRFGHAAVLDRRVRLDAGSRGRVVLGKGVWLAADVEIQTDTEVSIGDGTTVQRRCTINGTTRVGYGCIFAPNVFVSSGSHAFRVFPHLPIREQESRLACAGESAADRAVWIQDDCWLGTNVVISPGVTVGKGTVVGANAVVTADTRPYSIVAGAPARVVGERLSWQPPKTIDGRREEDWIYVLSGAKFRSHEVLRLTPDAPLLVALSADVSRVRLDYEAPVPVDIMIAATRHRLDTGIGSIECGADACHRVAGALMVELRLVESVVRRSDVAILRIDGIVA